MDKNTGMRSLIEAVRDYVKRGWAPVPIPYGEKAPRTKGWQHIRIREAELPSYFGTESNIGLLLGEPSGNLVDVDLDAPEARAVATAFLPPTERIHGRESSPNSHWWYVTDVGLEPKKFTDTDGTTLVEQRSTGQQTVVPPSVHPTGEVLYWEKKDAPLQVSGSELHSAVAKTAACALLARHWPAQGSRHDASLALAGFLICAGWHEAEAEVFISAVALAANDEEWQSRKKNVLTTASRIATGRPATGTQRLAELTGPDVVGRLRDWLRIRTRMLVASKEITVRTWPDPIRPEAYHGLAGEIVNVIEPHSEVDPVALLVQLLTAFGNVVGRGPHFTVEADVHCMNIFAVLVAVTSKGRKGMSWSHISRLFMTVASEWVRECVQSGLSSGEGIIWAVRDPTQKKEPVKRGGRVVEYQTVTTDHGVQDKRLFVMEPEFASALKVMRREGNTLSTTIRQAWDRGDLRVLTKNSPVRATGAHISIIGHITPEELRRSLETTEMGNGFANRFLWVAVRRSKCLPEGGRLYEFNLQPLLTRLRAAVEYARGVTLLQRDEEAREVWREVYPKLSEGRTGLLGAVTSRAEAQVMRLASIYALLDRSHMVRLPHLRAALALWDYAEASAQFVFGNSLGDPIADEILRALKASPRGLTRTEIRDHFGRNQESHRIGLALALLAEHGLAQFSKEESGGRPTERWIAVAPNTTKTI